MPSRLAFLVLLSLVFSGWTAPQEGETVFLNLSSASWPPYFVEDAGFAREVLETCLPASGYEPHFAEISIDDAYSGLRGGLVDGHVFSYREDREAFLVYGEETLFHDTYQPVVLAGNSVEISEIADLDSLRLGHLDGLRYSEEYLKYIQERRNQGKLVVAQDNQKLFDLLLSGRIDVFVNLASTTTWLAREAGIRERIQVLPLEVKSSGYYFAVARNSRRVRDIEALLAGMDQCLRAMREDGSYQTLAEKYDLN